MAYRTDIIGWSSEYDLRAVEALAKAVPRNGLIIEIGSFLGRTAWVWAKTAPTARVICIDLWNDAKVVRPHYDALVGDLSQFTEIRFSLTQFNTTMGTCPNVSTIRCDSMQVLPKLPASIADLVFIDGLHNNPVFESDLWHAMRVTKPGGIVSGHDFTDTFPDIPSSVVSAARKLNQALSVSTETSVWSFRLSG